MVPIISHLKNSDEPRPWGCCILRGEEPLWQEAMDRMSEESLAGVSAPLPVSHHHTLAVPVLQLSSECSLHRARYCA